MLRSSLNHCRIMQAVMLAGVALSGCAPSWYQRSADRAVAKIVEDRKQETLGYRPQSKAALPADPEPTKRAYEKIPQTTVGGLGIQVLEPLAVQWTPAPLGPAVPGKEDEATSFVPDYYADYGTNRQPQGPPAPGTVSHSLDLLGSIRYAVANSRDYRDRMEDLYLAALDVTLQRHLFDPTPFAKTTVRYAGDQGGAAGEPGHESAMAVVNRAGVSQQLPYGGEIVAEQLVTFVDSLSDRTVNADSAETVLRATVPLLRGAGMVNLEPLVSSERQLVYAVRAFENYRRQFAVDTASKFFQLVSAQQAIANRRQNYSSLYLLTERSMAMYAAGRMQFLDVQRARQNLLNAENSLVDSINVYEASLDSFKIVLGMPVIEDLDVVAVELDVKIPELDKVDSAALALKYRLEVQTARDRIDDARRGVSNARNGLLPSADLAASAGARAMENDNLWQYDRDATSYTAGIEIDWPVDRVNERNAYRRSLIQLERARRFYVQAREQATADVRQSTRVIRVALITLEIQKRNLELNQRRLDLANERLLQGRAQLLDVVDAQSALLSAQDALDRARANLQTQVLQYLRQTGTLRIDPGAGALGRALNREEVVAEDARTLDEIEHDIDKMETP